ncbi:hypothetical protein [Flavobacterium caseinilyticum]|uniref:Holin n=1 Tax=Flavobacterium caseinilyticum TaxID=2541732 RepID=A0A4R5AWE7_9FLAO|nr:hypothetical protein [Flavobacterium caseinilyticum]TDD77143.1 hypothetical protein E0F89_05965 [Flavobacterium caseinilyticum]
MKKWYQSKTIWVNLIAIILGILPLVDETLLTAVGVVNTQAYLYVIGFVTGILNLILRMTGGEQTKEIEGFESKEPESLE